MSITTNIRDKALATLDGMAEVVHNEMIVRGTYVTDEIVRPDLKAAGSICGGRQACAIGSLWLGYGVRMKYDGWGDLIMPGVEQDQREDFTRRRPGLRVALAALNAEADDYIRRNKLEAYVEDADLSNDSIENLFEATRTEGEWVHPEDGSEMTWKPGKPLVRRDALLRIIERAKARVSALETR